MEMDSAYLCHNIDWAFKVWQEQPWGRIFHLIHFVNTCYPIELMMSR